MSVVSNVIYTYRSPSKAFEFMYDRPTNEAKSLGYLMSACFLTYVAQWPYLARQAHLEDFNLQTSLAASLLAWLLIAPLLLYVVAILVYFLHRVLGGGKTSGPNQSGSLLVILCGNAGDDAFRTCKRVPWQRNCRKCCWVFLVYGPILFYPLRSGSC